MTGTAITEAGEFWEIYKLDVMKSLQTDQFKEVTEKIWFIKQKKNITRL